MTIIQIYSPFFSLIVSYNDYTHKRFWENILFLIVLSLVPGMYICNACSLLTRCGEFSN